MIESSAAYQTCIVGKTRRIYIRAVVDISDPDVIYDPLEAMNQAPWSKPLEMIDKDFTSPPRLVTLERNFWLLDGSYRLYPADFKVTEHVGLAGASESKETQEFDPPYWFEQPFHNYSVLQAFSLFFSEDPQDGVAEEFKVEVYSGTQVFFEQTVTGNRASVVQFSNFTVYDPTKIRVTVTKWSLPIHRPRFIDLVLGIYERWDGNMLASLNGTQQADFSCLSLPYGTVTLAMNNKSRRFEPRNKEGIFQSITDRQGIEVYIGVKLPDGTIEYKQIGIYYQYADGWKTGDNSMSMQWDLVDIVGLIANRTYITPDVLPATLGEWVYSIVSQLGESFLKMWHVDPDYIDLPVTANKREDVAGKTCGDILRWACMATATFPRADAENGKLTVEPMWREGNKIELRNLVRYPVMKANESIANIIFNLSDGTEYTVSGNTLASEKIVTVNNPFLHTKEQALSAARMILGNYGGNIIETTGRGDPASEIGDVDTVWLDESNATTARRKYQTFNIQNGVLQNCASSLLQADGSHLYDNFELITESGQWKAPAGVSSLRVAIGQGGQGGSKGQNGSLSFTGGWVSGEGNDSPGVVSASAGSRGQNGSGGKVWFGTINVNPQQIFDVYIGKGGSKSNTYGVPGSFGEESTFGQYSSENGQVFAGGYTDIANGDSYARTGVETPLDGTGDGAAGGSGGSAGSGYWYETFDPETGESTGWKTAVSRSPGAGKESKDGASGFVLLAWDKEGDRDE